MSCYASTVINAALAEVGYREKATNASLQDPAANAGSNNYTKYADAIDTLFPNFYNGKKNGYAWCDVFVDWLFLSCFGEAEAMRLLCQPAKSAGAGCTYSRQYYQACNQYSRTPAVGAQIFFSTDSGKTCNHTGIVYALDGDYVYTVEGNADNSVAKRSYKLSDLSINGYGLPKYDPEPVNSTGVIVVDVDRASCNQVIINIK